MKKLFLDVTFATLCTALLAACGGDSDGGANASTNAGASTLDEVYASEDDLPGCIEKYDGAVAFVKEGSTAFKCEDGRWENKGEYYANNDAIKNCTAKREGEVAYIVDEDKSLVCEDGKWENASAKTDDKGGEPAEPTEWASSSSVEIASNSSSSTSVSLSSSCNDEKDESSSESKNPESNGSAQASSSSSVEESSSSVASSSSVQSSSSIVVAMPCKTDEEDNCEYGILKDSRDGQEYKTVKIGGQVWMAENLNYAYTGVPFDNAYYASDSTSWCYDNVPANCARYGRLRYGRLYTWAAAMDSVGTWSTSGKGCGHGKDCSVASAGSATLVRGICPKGWHLPSHDEWEALFTAVGGSSTAGFKLKSATGWKINGNGTDAFGFSALPAGSRSYDGSYESEGYGAYFWSSTESSSYLAYHMYLRYVGGSVYLYDYNKDVGYSVRCLMD